MNKITFVQVQEQIPMVWGDENSFINYSSGLESAELKLRTYVGAAVVDSEIEAVEKLVQSIIIKDAFVLASPTLTLLHSGKTLMAADDSTSKPATTEDVQALVKALRYQVRIAMDALLALLEAAPITGWELSPSYCLISKGIIPNLTTLTSTTKPPATNEKFAWMEPTRMDFAREWRPLLVHHQYELEKYFGKTTIQEMLDDEYEELRYQLRLIMVELMWGDERKALLDRNDLMRQMADNIETYEFITDTDVYTKYIAAQAAKRSNSSDSRIYVGG